MNKRLEIRVQAELLEKFEKACEANYTNKSEVLRRAMLDYVRKNQKEEEKMKKIANATMHNQGAFRADFEKLGFDVEATPRLRPVSGAKDAYSLACEVVEQASRF